MKKERAGSGSMFLNCSVRDMPTRSDRVRDRQFIPVCVDYTFALINHGIVGIIANFLLKQKCGSGFDIQELGFLPSSETD